MDLEGEMVDAAPTAAERRMIMAKYIDREALVEWLKRIPLKDLSDGRGLCRVIFEDDFKRAIKKIPKGIIVDVSPVRHGLWETTNDGTHFCPHCGYDAPYTWDDIDRSFINSADDVPDRPSNYCPNCGAKMYGGED